MVQTRNLNVHEYLAHELMQRVSATIEHLSLSATKISLPPLLRHSFFKKSIQSPLSRARALSSLHPCPSGTSCTALLYMCSVYKFFGLVLCLCPLLSIISLPPLYYKKNIFPSINLFSFSMRSKPLAEQLPQAFSRLSRLPKILVSHPLSLYQFRESVPIILSQSSHYKSFRLVFRPPLSLLHIFHHLSNIFCVCFIICWISH